MKKYFLFILVFMMASCSSEEIIYDNVIPVEPVDVVPGWLEGEYYSALFNSNEHTFITEDNMTLNFSPYINTIISFDLIDVYTTQTEDTYTIHYYDGVNIIFRKNSEQNDKYIKVTYDDNGVIMEFGVFYKIK